TPDRHKPIVEVIFREAHSLKGAARAVNLAAVETLCQSMEGVFAGLKQGGIALTPEFFDMLHHAVENIENIMIDPNQEIDASLQEQIAAIKQDLDHLIGGNGNGPKQETAKEQKGDDQNRAPDERGAPSGAPAPKRAASIGEGHEKTTVPQGLEERQGVSGKPQAKSTPEERTPQSVQSGQSRRLISGTVRIATEKLDTLMLKAEELILLKLAERQQLMNLHDMLQSFELWKKKWAKLESELRILSKLVQKEETGGFSHASWVEFSHLLDWNQEYIQAIERKIRTLVQAAEHNHHSLGRMVDDLLDDMKMVTMLPFSTLFEILPRMIRDLGRNQGKEVDLKLQGGDIEIDRRILEELKDPVIHLLRNSIDHGVEDPAEREVAGKPRHGAISLTVVQTEGNKVEIVFSDDGNGIDADRVKEEAVAKGIISRKEAKGMGEHEALSLIFRSGVSTSPMITQISGRGLGLAIVQEKVEQLGGSLSLQTVPGKGTTFRMLLPVTMATFKGILVRVTDGLFVVPTSHVERVLRVKKDEVRTVENKATIPLKGKTLSLVDLADVLDTARKNRIEEEKDYITVLVLGIDERQIAFKIDEVLTEQEVLVKGMGKQLSRVRNIAGATVLGSGEVVPILNAQDLIKSAMKVKFVSSGIEIDETQADTRKKSILVVEDSITSRMLIKNILESSGYSVRTASDGLDGYNALKAEPVDLVVSDVEMPNMNGFELTAKIRSDKGLARIPVILCTSLESREDKERGIDVGANAYIVKSGFDQSNLLDVVKRLS
ncbi:MAG: response regulator, partial [bacterium]